MSRLHESHTGSFAWERSENSSRSFVPVNAGGMLESGPEGTIFVSSLMNLICLAQDWDIWDMLRLTTAFLHPSGRFSGGCETLLRTAVLSWHQHWKGCCWENRHLLHLQHSWLYQHMSNFTWGSSSISSGRWLASDFLSAPIWASLPVFAHIALSCSDDYCEQTNLKDHWTRNVTGRDWSDMTFE